MMYLSIILTNKSLKSTIDLNFDIVKAGNSDHVIRPGT